ncbi:hypothetical protein [uncultured Pontibacter sp.]|uniref:DUF3108 domain-containing protein n=1 Tax=uncultured Pontibacter sp. TaxID=453356 RepID=UPI002616B138|nr:hypothetical protein [uncultured Pontibacter sp.]
MKRIFLLAIATLITAYASAQTDTLRVTSKHLKVKQLKPGTRQYLVTVQTPANPKVLRQSLWTRNVSFEEVAGKEKLVIRQNWVGADTLTNRQLYSICEKDFKPVFHTGTSARGTAAFNFEPDRVVGADTVLNNGFKGFSIAAEAATFNWELDMETFESLPLKANTVYLINFYHPGSKTAPQYYSYKVTGSEKLLTVNNTSVDCWMLRIDYSDTNYGTFWISKKTHEVLKMEELFDGVKRFKIKLGTVVQV